MSRMISGICDQKCLNGGKCVQKDICECPKGYFGTHCEFCEYRRPRRPEPLFARLARAPRTAPASLPRYESRVPVTLVAFSQMLRALRERRQVQGKQHMQMPGGL